MGKDPWQRKVPFIAPDNPDRTSCSKSEPNVLVRNASYLTENELETLRCQVITTSDDNETAPKHLPD